MVPKMILQPIVENAVLHGLDGVDNGVVWVRVWRKDPDVLCISVTDNGRGLPDEMVGRYVQKKETAGRGHLGLYNVDTILKKHYGPDYGLYLGRREQGPGTVVTATLPLRKEEEPC